MKFPGIATLGQTGERVAVLEMDWPYARVALAEDHEVKTWWTNEMHLTPEKTSLDLVREFHRVYGQEVRDKPYVKDGRLNALRFRLLEEELNELMGALADGDPVEVLDALTDLQYVLDGAYLSLGLHEHKDAALAEVHRSNMSKLGEDGRPVLREDGKVMKGPSYIPPDLVKVLGGDA